ncbi:MAG: GatB/YqeY domain-containing protein [Proteobacteria bacterium]|nr:GatB/YqeY domain-containing protein [Pseudomonadota bacterium]
MGLKEDISANVITALKAKDKETTSTLRFLLSAVKNKEKDLRRDITDDEVQAVALAQVKQRQDSIEQFEKGGRDDLADKERAELEILKDYIPEQLTEDELRSVVKAAIAETGASTMKDMGKLMQASMARAKGKADGNVVSAIVKELLQG